MSAHSLPNDLSLSDFTYLDPGNAGALPNDRWARVPLITAAAETRTLAVPTKADLMLRLHMVTDGGDCVVTVAGAYDETGGTVLTFSDPGQKITLYSYEVDSGVYAWRVENYDGVTGPTQTIGTAATVTTLTATTINSTTENITTANVTTLAAGAVVADRATVKGIYLSATVAVAVPTIADAEADEVDVDISASLTVQPAVGDMVIAIPSEALPTDCLLNGAYVSATDHVNISFGTKEGGSGVTGANKNFKFLVIDLT